MTTPFSEHADARQAATAAAATGRFHDVVVGSSKLLHEVSLEDADREALSWALDMLDHAVSNSVVYAMPSSQQLATSGTTIVALRRAARSDDDDADQTLASVRDGLKAALSGTHDDSTRNAISALQALFSMVSRFALQSEVLAQSDRRAEPIWQIRTATLIS